MNAAPERAVLPADANWSYPTAIRFGAGRIKEIVSACEEAGIARPLLVTDPVLAKLRMVETVLTHCNNGLKIAEVFEDVHSNPAEADVLAGVAAYRAGGCDGVIALGGGSVLDCGKCIAFMQGQTRPIWDFEDIDDWWTRADAGAIAPVIAIPTTAGTGSEVGRAAVIIHPETRDKKIIFHPGMMPRVVILDPETTLGLPARLTAGAGMDALAHGLEAFFAPTFHPMSRGIAVEGIRLVKKSLVRAVSDGSDLSARSQMMVAASMGAVAFQKGLGAIHSLSHPVGAFYNTHHGMTNAVFMPYVLLFNRPAIEGPAEELSASLGLTNGFDGLLDWVLELREAIGVPHTLREFGVDDTQFDVLAARAVQDPSTATNPRTLDRGAALGLFRDAHGGTLRR
jgi:alcohol dehydrogenase